MKPRRCNGTGAFLLSPIQQGTNHREQQDCTDDGKECHGAPLSTYLRFAARAASMVA
jgi:hypothetical protein